MVACRYLGAGCTAARLVARGGGREREEEVDIQHKTARKILSSLSKWLPIKQPEFTAREIVFIIRQCQASTARALYALPPSYLRCVCLSAKKNGSRRCELLKPREGGREREREEKKRRERISIARPYTVRIPRESPAERMYERYDRVERGGNVGLVKSPRRYIIVISNRARFYWTFIGPGFRGVT